MELWMEGYAATGEHGSATYCGTYPAGTSIPEAARRWVAKDPAYRASYLSVDDKKGTASFWGCRFYDNETDARQSFG
jgi:hypothetical protein